MGLRWTAVWGALLLLGWSTVFAQTPLPKRDGLVLDQTEVLRQETTIALENLLAAYRETSGHEIAVLMATGSGDEDLYDYAGRVIAAWELGGAEGQGVLLLWSAQGVVLIRPGAALLERLPLETQTRILQDWVIPAFGAGDADAGILAGVQQIMKVLLGGTVDEPADEASTQSEEDAAASTDTMMENYAVSTSELDLDFPDNLGADAERVIDGMQRDWQETVRILVGEALIQARQLPQLVGQVIREASGSVVEAPLGKGRLVLFAVLAVASCFGLMALAMRCAICVALVFPVFVAPLLWVATGYTGLSLAVAVAALAFPVFAALLRALLRRPGQEDSAAERQRRQTVIGATAGKRPSAMPARYASTRAAAPAKPSRAIKPAAVAASGPAPSQPAPGVPAVKPMAGSPRAPLSQTFVRRLVGALARETAAAALDDLRRWRWWHFAILAGVVISVPIFLLPVLFVAAVWFLRSLRAKGLVEKALRVLETDPDPAVRSELVRLRQLMKDKTLRI